MVNLSERDDIFFNIESFSTLLFSTIETYPNECSGLLFGNEDMNPQNIRYDVWSAIPHQIVSERDENHVDEDAKAYHRLINCQKKITGGVLLGGFHSHTDGNPKISEKDKKYLRSKKLHSVEIIVGIEEEDEEGTDWKISRNHQEISGFIPIGDTFYAISIAGYYIQGNKIRRLELNSSYIEVLDELAKQGIYNFQAIGDLFELARNRRKDVYRVSTLLEELQEARENRFKVRKTIIKNFKEYIQS